jgi:hypothetical protein
METELCKLAAKWVTDKTPLINHEYTPFYHELLRGRNIRKVLEIGIARGGSLRMWQEYFPKAEIYGLDNLEYGVLVNEGRIRSFLCDQGSEGSLRAAAALVGGNCDLIIDDGSHRSAHQVLTAKVLIPLLLSPDGIYIIEDIWAKEEVLPYLPYEHELREFNTKKVWDDRIVIIRGGAKLRSVS